MPEIPLGMNAKKRQSAWTPEIQVLNMIAESSATNALGGVDHIQRPALVPFTAVGSGPIRGVYRLAGSFGGDFFVASALEWYRTTSAGVSTLLGSLSGTDLVIQAASRTRILAAAGGVVRSYSGGAVTTVVIPDGRIIYSVAHLNGYFILTELDTARFYWIAPGEVDPDGLSFATTESSPGAILKVERVADELWFFKQEGIEVWAPTGNPDLPFQRQEGRNYEKGCRSRDTVCRFDNGVAWVGNEGQLFRNGNSPIRISDNALDEQIRMSANGLLSAFSYVVDGHEMYVLRMEQGTWAYDASTQMISQFMSNERLQWRVQVGDFDTESPVVGDDTTNQLYRLRPGISNDNGEPMLRVVTGAIAVGGGSVGVDNISVYATTGTATTADQNPVMQLSWSDDTQNYNDPRFLPLGKQGNYGKPIRLNRLGRMDSPGRLYRFAMTDDCVWTLSGAAFNVALR